MLAPSPLPPPSLSHIRVRADTSVSSFESLNPPPSFPPPSKAQGVIADSAQSKFPKIFSKLDIDHIDVIGNGRKHLP